MRKLLKTVLAMSLVMAMGVTAMAAPSISSSYEVSGVTADNGKTVELAVSAPEEKVTAAEAVELLGLSSDAEDVAVVVQEITLYVDGQAVTADNYDDFVNYFPLTITVAIDGITSSSSVSILHYTSNNVWEEETVTAVGDGTVTFTVSSLSPIAVVVEDAATATAPQTGEFGMTAVMALAVLALGTAFFVSRKKTA